MNEGLQRIYLWENTACHNEICVGSMSYSGSKEGGGNALQLVVICVCWSLEVVGQSARSTCVCGKETFGQTQEAVLPWGQNSDVWKRARHAVLCVSFCWIRHFALS